MRLEKNILTYDCCYLARAYLPRVWWTDGALTSIRAGTDVRVSYGESVRELHANALHDWFEDYGAVFGWIPVTDLSELQAAANGGGVCIIVAQRTNTNAAGHISAVVPEHREIRARRNRDGDVVRPVESQAGRSNHRASVRAGSPWWHGDRFRSFGFWRHA